MPEPLTIEELKKAIADRLGWCPEVLTQEEERETRKILEKEENDRARN